MRQQTVRNLSIKMNEDCFEKKQAQTIKRKISSRKQFIER